MYCPTSLLFMAFYEPIFAQLVTTPPCKAVISRTITHIPWHQNVLLERLRQALPGNVVPTVPRFPWSDAAMRSRTCQIRWVRRIMHACSFSMLLDVDDFCIKPQSKRIKNGKNQVKQT